MLEVLLVATEGCLMLVHDLIELGEFMENDVLMIATRHGAAVALGRRIIAFKVVMRIALPHRHLFTQKGYKNDISPMSSIQPNKYIP
jgi:hypothetical protein